uniref:Uncharacterized protein n=1 Tax=Pyramimonas orientalis virus TaxID=455367 RepID=A0A7M3UPE3_POV01|nr:hypothetical protein HWQ62_00497 [Pyramimonas orientalis virus]
MSIAKQPNMTLQYQVDVRIQQEIQKDNWTKSRLSVNCFHTMKHLELIYNQLSHDNEFLEILNMLS